MYMYVSVCHWAYTKSINGSHQINSENVENNVYVNVFEAGAFIAHFLFVERNYYIESWIDVACTNAHCYECFIPLAHTLDVLVCMFFWLPPSPNIIEISIIQRHNGFISLLPETHTHTCRLLHLVNSRLVYVMSWPNFGLPFPFRLHATP